MPEWLELHQADTLNQEFKLDLGHGKLGPNNLSHCLLSLSLYYRKVESGKEAGLKGMPSIILTGVLNQQVEYILLTCIISADNNV